jgi:uncharacterized protein YjiK
VDDVQHCTNDLAMYRVFRKQFEKKFKLTVVNPEGITFGPDGGLYVVSDDMGNMYRFDSSILFN